MADPLFLTCTEFWFCVLHMRLCERERVYLPCPHQLVQFLIKPFKVQLAFLISGGLIARGETIEFARWLGCLPHTCWTWIPSPTFHWVPQSTGGVSFKYGPQNKEIK